MCPVKTFYPLRRCRTSFCCANFAASNTPIQTLHYRAICVHSLPSVSIRCHLCSFGAVCVLSLPSFHVDAVSNASMSSLTSIMICQIFCVIFIPQYCDNNGQWISHVSSTPQTLRYSDTNVVLTDTTYRCIDWLWHESIHLVSLVPHCHIIQLSLRCPLLYVSIRPSLKLLSSAIRLYTPVSDTPFRRVEIRSHQKQRSASTSVNNLV